MRTTLDIDVDVLAAAKELAASENSTAGKVLSRLARLALVNGNSTPPNSHHARESSSVSSPVFSPVYGFEPFSGLGSTGALVTNNLINKLRNDEGI